VPAKELSVGDDLRRESDELVRYCAELSRRIGQSGSGDMSGLLSLYERFRLALDTVSAQELLWADQRAQQLIDKLTAMRGDLEALRRLKTRAGQDAAPADPHGAESGS
jgi:hypothetical protein